MSRVHTGVVKAFRALVRFTDKPARTQAPSRFVYPKGSTHMYMLPAKSRRPDHIQSRSERSIGSGFSLAQYQKGRLRTRCPCMARQSTLDDTCRMHTR